MTRFFPMTVIVALGMIAPPSTRAQRSAAHASKETPVQKPDPFIRQGHTLTIRPEATDADLQTLTPDPSIKRIDLMGGLNRARSKLTDAGLASLSRWTHLEALSLSNSAASSQTSRGLAALSHLRILILMDCPQMSGKDITHLAALTRLRELWLDGTPVSDEAMTTVGGLKALEVLRLFRSPVTDAGFLKLAGLTHLRDLQLGDTRITDRSLPIIATMNQLETLDLRAKVTGAGLGYLQNLVKLRWLALAPGADDASVAALAPLQNLETLYLIQSSVTDAGLRSLAKLPRLKTLDLSQSRVTDAGVELLLAIPSLKDLRLGGTRISDRTLEIVGTPPLASSQRLESLSIGDTAVTPPAIARLKRRRPDLRLEGLRVTPGTE